MADNKLIQSIERASQIIDCFSENQLELMLGEICAKTNLNKSTVYGLIRTLEHEQYIVQDDNTKKYRLGVKFVAKGNLALASLNIISLVAPFIGQLNTKYNESVNFFLYEGGTLQCVYALGSNSIAAMRTEVGVTLPLLATASGKIILASLPEKEAEHIIDNSTFTQYTPNTVLDKKNLYKQLTEIKTNGYAFENEETNAGVSSIAASIRDYNGIVGTISLTGTSVRLNQIKDNAISDIMNVAKNVSLLLGAH